LSAITAAKVLGGTVHGFIAGATVSGAAQDAAKVDGIEKIITVDNAAYEKVCTTYPRAWVNTI
jgi:electron transfer flavoprotein alpha subunit